jgi:hypothetical protein
LPCHFFPRAELAILSLLFSSFFCFCSDVSPSSCIFSVSHQRPGGVINYSKVIGSLRTNDRPYHPLYNNTSTCFQQSS